ncbi:hypothetical protein G7068_03215 [Leucobacter viscericola]|uniref:Uncharacterized protein n=1 Tax=Leucobacter viscericola TaxID=2714935 RepID=A0A6G7XCK4_9MICO|nr:hypothetical protein [Leucobacter viscericola]QIK62324.1 hypothetical protein G7068_03215 [Leucobacter viscericola]
MTSGNAFPSSSTPLPNDTVSESNGGNSATVTGKAGIGTGEQGNRGTEEQRNSSSSEVAIATIRPDYEKLLDLLDDLIVENGSKKPTRTKRNSDAIRLLVEKDGRTVQQVENAIRWSQQDEFWRGNILSASKLRAQYDKLRLAAEREKRGSQHALPPNQNRALALISHYEEQEARNEQTANREITDGSGVY